MKTISILLMAAAMVEGKNIYSTSTCNLMITDEMQVRPENLMKKIEKFPKYFRFESEIRLNSNVGFPQFRVNQTPKYGLQNIFHVSTRDNADSTCSSTDAGRLPSMFAYMDKEGEFKYILVEFCQGNQLKDMYIKPEDINFNKQDWIKFKMEQSKQTGKTSIWINDIRILDVPFDQVYEYTNVNVWAASDLWQKQYGWPVADANIRHLAMCELSD